MHSLKRKRVHYNGGSSLIQLSARTYEEAIAHQAQDEAATLRFAQAEYDAAREAHYRAIHSVEIDEAQKQLLKMTWHRVELVVKALRAEAAKRRIQAREFKQKLDALTKGCDTH